MDPQESPTHQFDRMLELIGDLARRADGRNREPVPPKSSVWAVISKYTSSFVLGAALALGVSHEVGMSPAHDIQATQTVHAEPQLQKASLAQITHDAARFGQKLSDSSASPDSYATLLADVSKDVKSVLKFSCAQPAVEEGMDLFVLLQVEAARKVASAEQVTSVERRVQRFIELVKSLCG